MTWGHGDPLAALERLTEHAVRPYTPPPTRAIRGVSCLLCGALGETRTAVPHAPACAVTALREALAPTDAELPDLDPSAAVGVAVPQVRMLLAADATPQAAHALGVVDRSPRGLAALGDLVAAGYLRVAREPQGQTRTVTRYAITPDGAAFRVHLARLEAARQAREGVVPCT